MTRKLFLIFFSFSLIFIVFHSDDCYAQRIKRSGNTKRTFQKPNKNRITKKTISGREKNSTKKNKRNFKDVEKKNNDINTKRKKDINKKDINRNDINRNDINRNDININKGNININRNTNVYHGYRYSGYNRYKYHSYSPYRWGPYWHPRGFFIATMYTTAVLISVSSQSYYYYEGVYYVPSGSGYEVTTAPVGASITELPAEYASVAVASTNYYYYGGTFYVLSGDSYVVVEAPIGAEEILMLLLKRPLVQL